MDVYKYIAENNPMVAQGIIESYGYGHANTPDMGLSQVVARVGEPALKKVMEHHPDKDLILEMFAEKPSSCGCGCNKGKQEKFLNIEGAEAAKEKESSTNMIAQQTNVMILVSALFIFTALMIKK
jgi:hypothetical protein